MKRSKKVLFCTGRTQDKPLVYVLRGTQGDLLIDTGTEACVHQIDLWIRRNEFNIKWIFLTHGHFDHTWNARFFKQKYGAKVMLHEKDRKLLSEGEFRLVNASSDRTEKITAVVNEVTQGIVAPYCKIDRLITDADTELLHTLGFDAEIVMLPGHTEGSMGILQNRVLYCGDAISAKGGDYYTAMFGENVGAIYESEEKIFALNPLVIAPGHGRLVVNEKAF